MIPTVDGEGTSVIVNVKESEFTTALTQHFQKVI